MQIYLGISQPSAEEVPLLDEKSFFYGLGSKFAETKRELEQTNAAKQREDSIAKDEMKSLAGQMVEYLNEKTGDKAIKMTLELDLSNAFKVKFSGESWIVDHYSAVFKKATTEDSTFAKMNERMETLMRSLSTGDKKVVLTDF